MHLQTAKKFSQKTQKFPYTGNGESFIIKISTKSTTRDWELTLLLYLEKN